MRAFLPLLVTSLGFAGLACSSYDNGVSLTPPKDNVATTYKVQAAAYIASNAFTCAAQVAPSSEGTDLTTVTVPKALYDKAASELTAGRVVLLKGMVGNASNTGGFSFEFVSASPSADGKSMVLQVKRVSAEKAFENINLEADYDMGSTTSAPAAQCAPDGSYIAPASSASGTPSGPDDPALAREGSKVSEVEPNAKADTSPPSGSGMDRPFKDRKGLHFEIPPKNLFLFETEIPGDNGDKIAGSLRGDLDGAYIDVIGRIKPRLRITGVQLGYEAEMDAKVQLSIALKIAAISAQRGRVSFERVNPLDPLLIGTPLGTVTVKRDFIVKCDAHGTAEIKAKAGAWAHGKAFAGAELNWAGTVTPVFDYSIKAGPIWELSTTGNFDGECSAELRFSVYTWSSSDSFIGARVYVNSDLRPSAPCVISGGLKVPAHLDLPWPIPTVNFNIFDLKAAPEGAACTNQNATDYCQGLADGNHCDASEPSHGFRCAGGKATGTDQYCKVEGTACTSFAAGGLMQCN